MARSGGPQLSEYVAGMYVRAIPGLLLGRAAGGEAHARQEMESADAVERDAFLIVLYLAAERQGTGRGRSATADMLQNVDEKKWPGPLLLYAAGRIDRDTLLKCVRSSPENARARAIEAYFLIGQLLLAQGQRPAALPWLHRCAETGAATHPFVAAAKLERKVAN
jgi:hypothetical protein